MSRKTNVKEPRRELKYIVKHAFQYGAVNYKPGDIFEPQGARNDTTIIRTYVRAEYVDIVEKEAINA